jgi:hypothetical protein
MTKLLEKAFAEATKLPKTKNGSNRQIVVIHGADDTPVAAH